MKEECWALRVGTIAMGRERSDHAIKMERGGEPEGLRARP